MNVLEATPRGLFCPAGNFYIDPPVPVKTAVLTHLHGDHARAGSGEYFCAEGSAALVKHRLGPETVVYEIPYGQAFEIGGTKLSFHSAGHILGSAQVAVETKNSPEKWVMSGDYKRDPDASCPPFESVACDVFITEATFGLPIYRWEPIETIMAELTQWWNHNRDQVLAELARLGETRTVYTHGAVETITEIYCRHGVRLLATEKVSDEKKDYAGDLIIAPPSSFLSPWSRRFGAMESAFASGWMRIRGNRRRRGYARGFTISDHADWPSLLKTIEESRARKILVTHGYAHPLVRFLQERGQPAESLSTTFEGETET
jgi:putative mRNA 3-end processing factor